MAVGATFPYRLCPATAKPEITDAIAGVWMACKPLLDVMLKGRWQRLLLDQIPEMNSPTVIQGKPIGTP
jgi:hypothetical protein